MNASGVILFHTTSAALKAEKVAKKAGLKAKLVPTPRHLSSDCGISLCFDWTDRETMETALKKANVPLEGIHSFDAP